MCAPPAHCCREAQGRARDLTAFIDPGEAGELEVCRRAVASLGVEFLYMPVFSAADVDKALRQAAEAGADALMALPDGVTTPKRDSIAWDAASRRVPTGSGWPFFAEGGFLMTFGPDPRECYRRVGHLAARVLDGTKPADLPIEQPTASTRS
jgi:putative ABC transport system substrate-binding protein